MKQLIIGLLVFCVSAAYSQKPPVPAIVIHGGAGTIERSNLSAQEETEIRAVLQRALDTGYSILENGGSATDAVMAAITILEDAPQFNAGKGAVMNDAGTHELDASIMDGLNLNAGAVAGSSIIKNPILAANEVMLRSPHVLLTGKGADEFARQQKLSIVENKYFTTPAVQEKWKKLKSERQNTRGESVPTIREFSKFGTVGAVAIDKEGSLAAGTSTGGMMGKLYNRVGDSPIIGAGTYADNNTCAVSCTGHGEYFMRIAVAKEISDQIEFAKKPLADAVTYTLITKLVSMGGSGGLIAIDKYGNIVMDFTTPGMYRGYKHAKGTKTAIYADE
jgi:beta-aspartyl-peptidase (threonine type)